MVQNYSQPQIPLYTHQTLSKEPDLTVTSMSSQMPIWIFSMKRKTSLQMEHGDHEHPPKTYHSSLFRNPDLMNTTVSDQTPAWVLMMGYRMRRKAENRDHHLKPLQNQPKPSMTPAQMIPTTANYLRRKRTDKPTGRLGKRAGQPLGRRMEM